MVENPLEFLELGNSMWKTCIDKGITPREFGKKGLLPRPHSVSSFIGFMKLGFNSVQAAELNKAIQFNFSGDCQDSCYLTIADGSIRGQLGRSQQPDLTIDTPFGLWMDISTGKADGQQMFMEQKYTAKGDLALLMQMGQLFQRKD
jgi:putative sterol carrier protein